MSNSSKTSKQELKEREKQIKERFAAFRRGSREDEINDHNGKPFTHPQVTKDKTKYNRKIMKKVSRDDY